MIFHDPGERPDTAKAHREDVLSGQVDRWDDLDAEMDGPREIPGQIDIFGGEAW